MAASVVLSAGSDFIGPNSLFDDSQQSFTKYASQTISVPFDTNGVTFGNNVTATIPKKDDIIRSIYLKSTLGPLYNMGGTGYVYPGYPADIDISIHNLDNEIIVDGVNTIGHYNTQLLTLWLYKTNPATNITFNGSKFVFTGFDRFYFLTEQAASFWGFDVTNGTFYDAGAQPVFSLVQSGWIQGFQPIPYGFNYYDSVGDLLVNNATLYIGAQTIQTIDSTITKIEDDINIPLENQAGLTITVGRNDGSTSFTPRTYWTRLDFDPIVLSSLYKQSVKVGVQFEQFTNLTSVSLLGGITNPNAYKPILNFENLDVIKSYKSFIGLSTQGFFGLFDETTEEIYTAPGFIYTCDTLFDFSGDNLYLMVVGSEGIGNYLANFIGISNQRLDNYDQSGYDISYYTTSGAPPCIVSSSYYLFILYPDIVLYFDTRYDINDRNGYSAGFPINVLAGYYVQVESAVSIGRYIYVTASQNIGSAATIIEIDTLAMVSGTGTIFTYSTPSLVYNYNSPLRSPVTDGAYLYFARNEGGGNVYRVNINLSLQIENSPITDYIVPMVFDGQYVYYTKGYFYDTTRRFSDIESWSHVTNLPVPGLYDNFGYVFGALCSKFVYLFDRTSNNIYRVDRNKVVPSLQTELIVEYSKMVEPARESTTLVNQNQLNTFTMRAGNIKDVFSLTFTGPVRELWIQSDVIIKRTILELNGEVLVDEDYKSLGILRPFKDHLITPTKPFYSYSISLEPNVIEPLGTLNISRVAYPTIQFELNQTYSTDQTIKVYSRSINVLECQGGIGGLLYN